MDIAVQLLFNGLIAGSIYALVASGFSLIYATNRFMHFAHGGIVTLGAYLIYAFFVIGGLNFYLASLCAIIGTGVLGWLMHRIIYKPLKKRKSSNAVLLMVSVGLMILFENSVLLIFGAQIKSLNFITIRKGLDVFGAIITPLQIVIICSTVLLLAILWIFMAHTKAGKTIRAVADNPDLAAISGINIHRTHALSFIIGSSIAGFGAILIALEQHLEPTMGLLLIIKGFTGAIIGGVSSVPGAILGSYVLGLVENFGIWFLPSGYKDAIAFVLLFIFLLWRPTGILGINKGLKE